MTEIERSDGVVRVRPYRPEDEDALYAAVRESIAELGRWLPWAHPAYAREDARGWIETTRTLLDTGDGWHLAVLDAGGGGFLGGVGLGPRDRLHAMVNLGWWVRTGATGRGVATRASELAAQIGLELGFMRLQILVRPDNAASLRVAEKLGARREGFLRNRIVFGERAHDAVVFSLIPGDLDHGSARR